MRVLLPTIELPTARGGVGRYIDAIAKTLREIEVVELLSGRVVEIVRMFYRTRKNYDAIWTHHVLPVGTAAWVARIFGGLPYTVFLHGLDFDLARRNVWKRWLTRRILRGAAHVVANSQALADEVLAFARKRECLVVYPCVSDELVVEAQAPSSSPITGGGPLRLLTVGRLVVRKGHMKVLEAMKDFTDVQYTIVGDGPMREAIEAKIQELGLTDRVTLRTDVTDTDLPDVYRNADVFVMPSTKSNNDREGFGIVYIEAALFGVPSIAVRQPGVDEAIVDGVTGWLIDDSIDTLRMLMGHIRADRTLCVPRGKAAKNRVFAEFTREAQFGKLRAIL